MEYNKVRESQQKFTFQGKHVMYYLKINRPTKWIEQTIEIFNLNFRPGFKLP